MVWIVIDNLTMEGELWFIQVEKTVRNMQMFLGIADLLGQLRR
jgi:hypothetical protein